MYPLQLCEYNIQDWYVNMTTPNNMGEACHGRSLPWEKHVALL